MSLKYLALALLNVALLVTGQFLWKFGLRQSGEFSLWILLNPYVVAGLVVYGIATIVWLYVIKSVELSLVYPLSSLGYALALVVGVVWFGETFTIAKAVGSGLIMLGVVVLTCF